MPLLLGNPLLCGVLRQNTHGLLPDNVGVNSSDVSLSKNTVSDSEDCIGNKSPVS